MKELDPADIRANFPELCEENHQKLQELLSGNAVGRKICHLWFENGVNVLYNGKIEKLKCKTQKYTIAYWGELDTYDDATDFEVSVYELAADFIYDDLVI